MAAMTVTIIIVANPLCESTPLFYYKNLSKTIPKKGYCTSRIVSPNHDNSSKAENSYHPIWLRIVDDVRTVFMKMDEAVYIPDLRNLSSLHQ